MGQLGTIVSSARFKENVRSVGDREIQGLYRLHPCQFRYIQNQADPVDPLVPAVLADPADQDRYGLIAEDVDLVLPELVIHGKNGDAETVNYPQLLPLLLAGIRTQKERLDVLEKNISLFAKK